MLITLTLDKHRMLTIEVKEPPINSKILIHSDWKETKNIPESQDKKETQTHPPVSPTIIKLETEILREIMANLVKLIKTNKTKDRSMTTVSNKMKIKMAFDNFQMLQNNPLEYSQQIITCSLTHCHPQERS